MAKLELGCGLNPTDGYLHHDKWRHSDFVDVTHDLNLRPWPWAAGQFDAVRAYDVMEHLTVRVQTWLAECWRILRPAGRLRLRLPYWRHENAWTDPKHKQFFALQSFDYWDPDKELYQKYGKIDHAWGGRLWRVERAELNAHEGNLYFVLEKIRDARS